MSYTAGADDPLLTVEQFEQLPEEDEFRIELVRGRMVREPRPGAEHSTLTGWLYEKLSAHVRARGLQEKVVEYLDASTREVWVVDPAARQVTVYRSGGETFLLREADALEGGGVVPDFSLPLAELFGATSLR